jgi:hypothetical protein
VCILERVSGIKVSGASRPSSYDTPSYGVPDHVVRSRIVLGHWTYSRFSRHPLFPDVSCPGIVMQYEGHVADSIRLNDLGGIPLDMNPGCSLENHNEM